jgi:hypothetical protein
MMCVRHESLIRGGHNFPEWVQSFTTVYKHTEGEGGVGQWNTKFQGSVRSPLKVHHNISTSTAIGQYAISN